MTLKHAPVSYQKENFFLRYGNTIEDRHSTKARDYQGKRENPRYRFLLPFTDFWTPFVRFQSGSPCPWCKSCDKDACRRVLGQTRRFTHAQIFGFNWGRRKNCTKMLRNLLLLYNFLIFALCQPIEQGNKMLLFFFLFFEATFKQFFEKLQEKFLEISSNLWKAFK